MKKIGMVGIGLMGHGIATNLLKHGHELAVLDHPGNQPLDALRASGVQVMSDLAGVDITSLISALVAKAAAPNAPIDAAAAPNAPIDAAVVPSAPSADS
jgi:3-hydroxyisobutyrate dehydrogenase-like beta-hydroxyacid dehydrogenase